MNLAQLEHALRAAQVVADDHSFFVIGTAALLPQHPDLGDVVVVSDEADLWPVNRPENAGALDCIGEMSPFHDLHGFFVDPFDPAIAVLPEGWEQRAIRWANANTHDCVGLCLEKHDLVVAKMGRGEKKDLRFVERLLSLELVDSGEVVRRIELVDPQRLHYQQDGEAPGLDVRVRLRANFQRVIAASEAPPKAAKRRQGPSRP